MVSKRFVLDTNVLLHDPFAINRFGQNEVVLPIYVVEELDQFKKSVNGLGRNARAVARQLDELRKTGRLNEGVDLENGGRLTVMILSKDIPDTAHFVVQHMYDNLILKCALVLKEQEPEIAVTVVTKDTNLRIRADAVGLEAQDYEPTPVDVSLLYQGHRELVVSSDQIRASFRDGLSVDVDDLAANEYVILVDKDSDTHTALGRYRSQTGLITAVPRLDEGVWGVRPKNREQICALDVLLDDSVKVVTMVGKAGTGKTLLALAAGLKRTTDDQRYQRVLVSRPIFPLGRDIGFLPGTVEEKLDPWMKPIFDNVEFLLGRRSDGRRGRGPETLVEMGVLEIEPLTYIRGRSIPDQYMIVDEAQNLTPHEVKTILTRAGEGTKLVFTGDPYQIDNPYVDASDNGLVYLVNRLKDQPLAGSVTLMQGERSPLAEMAANLL
jgi:PhoH-like ATPase